jgi:hypothetical protein
LAGHIAEGEWEGELVDEVSGAGELGEEMDTNLNSRNGPEWFAGVSENLEAVVQGWAKDLMGFFINNPCEAGDGIWLGCFLEWN